jgi:DNA-binding MarR family transcriptional regulator
MRANEAWEALMTAHAVLIKEFAATDVWQDLSMREYDVLYTLSKCPEPQRMSELNRHVLLSQPALSRMVDRLVEKSFVARLSDPSDGRGVRLALTPSGQEKQRAIGAPHARSVARAVNSALSNEEMQTLAELCLKLAGKERT